MVAFHIRTYLIPFLITYHTAYLQLVLLQCRPICTFVSFSHFYKLNMSYIFFVPSIVPRYPFTFYFEKSRGKNRRSECTNPWKINLSGEFTNPARSPLILNLKIRCLSLKLRFSPVEIGLGKRYPTLLSISWSKPAWCQDFPLILDKWVAVHNFWAISVQYRVSLWYHTYCNLDNTCTNTWGHPHQPKYHTCRGCIIQVHHTNTSEDAS